MWAVVRRSLQVHILSETFVNPPEKMCIAGDERVVYHATDIYMHIMHVDICCVGCTCIAKDRTLLPTEVLCKPILVYM